jgi:hypothetical protein
MQASSVFNPVFVVKTTAVDKMDLAMFIILTEGDEAFEPLKHVELSRTPLGEFTLLQADDLYWLIEDIAAYTQMLSRAFAGLVLPWIASAQSPLGFTVDLAPDLAALVLSKVSATKQGKPEGHERMYESLDPYLRPSKVNNEALPGVGAQRASKAEAFFNSAGLEMRSNEFTGAVEAYHKEAAEFWPCDVQHHQEFETLAQARAFLFPRHWLTRYETTEELVKLGALRTQDVMLHRGRYYEPAHVLQALDRLPSAVVVLGPCGVGKTKSFWKAIAELERQGEPMLVLAISIRISQAKDMVRVAEECGVELATYKRSTKDVVPVSKATLLARKYVVCSLENAMWKLGLEWAEQNQGKYVLLLDETPEVLTSLASSDTVKKNREDTANVLKDAVCKAKVVYMMSADLRARHVTRLLSWRDEDKRSTVLLDIKRRDEELAEMKTIVPMKNEAECKALLRDRLRGGQRFSVACFSRIKAEEIDRMVTSLQVPGVTLHQYTTTAAMEEATDNDVLREVQYLVFTPTVGPGVSFDIDGHFTCGLLWGNPKIAVEAHLQAIARVRDMKNFLGERVVYAYVPSFAWNKEDPDTDTSAEKVEEEWRISSESEAVRTGRPLEGPHPVLYPLQVDAESQKRTDKYNFTTRFFAEARRADYVIACDESFRRVTRVEAARDVAKEDEYRAQIVTSEVDAMLALEAAGEFEHDFPGITYANIRDRRSQGEDLSGIEKRYMNFIEKVRQFEFTNITEVGRDFALAIAGDYDLAWNVRGLMRFEEVRKPPNEIPSNSNSMLPYTRDEITRELLRMVNLSGLGKSTTYINSMVLIAEDRQYLVDLVRDFPRKFLAIVQNEDAKQRKTPENPNPPVQDDPEVPTPCPVRLALSFLNVLLKHLGLKIDKTNMNRTHKYTQDPDYHPVLGMDVDPTDLIDQVQEDTRGLPRQEGPGVAFYKLEACSELGLMYGILARSSKLRNEHFMAGIDAYLAANPLVEGVGEALMRKKAASSKEALNELVENMAASFENSMEENDRQYFAKSSGVWPAPETEEWV